MSSKKSIDERLAQLQIKQEQLKAQERALKARKSEQDRKNRTRRLITIGATMESVLHYPIEGAELDKLMEDIRQLMIRRSESINDQERLAEIGRIVEDVLGRAVTADDMVRFRSYLVGQESRGKYFSRAMEP